mgnify:CR=1 FL=1
MEEWKEYKLADVCSRLRSGKGIKSDSVLDAGPYPVIGGNGIRGYANESNFKGECAVIGRQGAYCGNVRFYEGEAYMTEHAVVVVGNELADTRFLACLLSLMHLGNLSAQSAQPGISVQTLSKQIVSLPSIDYQKRVSAVIKSLDDKIEVNRRINENLEQQAQALFKSWFVDFEPFKDQPFVESELGMIPQGWKVGTFLDNINVMPGGTPSTGVEEYWKDGDIPFFSPKDVNGVYCFETEKRITEKGLKNCSSHLYPKDTLFITARGTVGKLALAGVPMAMNQSNYALVAKEGIGKYYLYLLAQTMVAVLLKKANGAVFSAITTKDFNEPTLVLSQSVLERFEKIITPLFNKIYETSKESRRLADLRDTLLPKLMSGEININEVCL